MGVTVDHFDNQVTTVLSDALGDRKEFIVEETDAPMGIQTAGSQLTMRDASAIIGYKNALSTTTYNNQVPLACCQFKTLNKRSYKRIRDKAAAYKTTYCNPAAVTCALITDVSYTATTPVVADAASNIARTNYSINYPGI